MYLILIMLYFIQYKWKRVNNMIDLHTHTIYSDGTDSVKELLRNAENNKLEILSITDHNICNAYKEMENIDVDELFKGRIIVGCEFTTSFDNRLIEVLGYGFDYKKVNDYLLNYYNEEYNQNKLLILRRRLLNILDKYQFTYDINKINEGLKNNSFEFSTYIEIIKYKENFLKTNENIFNSFSDFYRRGITNPNSIFLLNILNFIYR